MTWAIRYIDSGNYVGWPSPLVYKTKKEARIKRDRIVHQLRGGGGEMEIVEVDMPVPDEIKLRK